MDKEEQVLCNHLADLASACNQRNYPVGSDFLSLSEQSQFLSYVGQHKLPVGYSLTGGYEDAERKIVYFEPEGVGFKVPAPLSLLALQQKNNRFTRPAGHRDYLGAVINLGLNRSKLGDILVQDDRAYLICSETIADFICENLKSVGSNPVSCTIVDWQEFTYVPKVKEICTSVASIRLDSIISAAFSKSRSTMSEYIKAGKVFINGKCFTSCSKDLNDGDLVSVRGLGKLRFSGSQGTSKKGRTYVKIDLFV